MLLMDLQSIKNLTLKVGLQFQPEPFVPVWNCNPAERRIL